MERAADCGPLLWSALVDRWAGLGWRLAALIVPWNDAAEWEGIGEGREVGTGESRQLVIACLENERQEKLVLDMLGIPRSAYHLVRHQSQCS